MLELASFLFVLLFLGTLLSHAIYKHLWMTCVNSAGFVLMALVYSLFALLKSDFASLVIPASGLAGMGLGLISVIRYERRKKRKP